MPPGKAEADHRQQWLPFCRETFQQPHGVIRTGQSGDLAPHPFRVQPIGWVREHIGGLGSHAVRRRFQRLDHAGDMEVAALALRG